MFNQNSQPFTDPDGDNLTLSFLGGPSGLVFTDNGDGSFNVSGTPTSGTSPWSVSVTATDGNGGSTTAVFSLTCSTSSTLDCSVIPSTINCADLPYTLNVSGATSYNVTFSGSDYTFSGGQIIDTTGGSGGDDTATITATDGSSSCTATMVIAACSTQSIPMFVGADCPAFPTAESGFPSVQTLGAFEAVTGGVAPITLVITGLPSGVTPDDLGNGSYRLDVASNTQPSGAVGYTVTATDANGDVFVCNGSFIEIIGF